MFDHFLNILLGWILIALGVIFAAAVAAAMTGFPFGLCIVVAVIAFGWAYNEMS